MDPYDEQRLRDEVIYLHSLWHQGPPTTPNPIPIPIPIQIPRPNISSVPPYIPQPVGAHFHGSPWHHHQHTINPIPTYPFAPTRPRPLPPTNSTTFKKRKKNKKKKKKKHRRDTTKNPTQPDPPHSPGSDWPCPVSPEDSAPPSTGWPALKPHSTPAVSPQEQERLSALQAQHKACQAFRELLFDSDEDEDDDVVLEEDEDVGDDGFEEFEELFLRILMEDDELRSYYQRCYEGGEFCCLVCGAIGKKKSGKKFRDCVGLVQHSMSISRTVKKRAHRAFGQAVCKILGWDIDRLPMIVMKGEPLGCSVVMKPAQEEGETKENAADDDKVVSLEHGDKPVEVEELVQGVDQTIGEGISKEGDLKNNIENLDGKILDLDTRLENGGGGAIDEVSHESLVSGAEWVCKNSNCDSSSTASGWPSFNTKSSSHTSSLSAEEQANVAVLHLQHKALEACQEFLVGNAGSDCDDDNDDEDEDELIDDSDSEECEEFKFFLRLFTEDSDLRRYYENNCREGDFYCLVCGGIGKKIWKRFKDCIALLQHSTAIKRTKRKRAHRAYSQVICKVLGWDIDRLPAIVLKGESLSSSLAGSSKLSGEPEKPADSCIDDSNLSIIHEISGEPDKPADAHIDDSDVLQES